MSHAGNLICELAIDPYKVVVVRGYANECQLLHGQPLEEYCYRVFIVMSVDYSTLLPFPLEDISTVGEAICTYVTCPTRLVILDPQACYQN